MKIVKVDNCDRYVMLLEDSNVSIPFSTYKISGGGYLVELWECTYAGESRLVCMLHGPKVAEFGKTWREMLCRED